MPGSSSRSPPSPIISSPARTSADVVAALRREFPATEGTRETLAETFVRLERIKPGITNKARDILIDSTLTVIPTAACGPEPTGGSGHRVPLVIENRSNELVAFNTVSEIEYALGIEMLRGNLDADADTGALVAELLGSEKYATRLSPGQRGIRDGEPSGSQWHIVGGGCFTVPDEPARFVWTGR